MAAASSAATHDADASAPPPAAAATDATLEDVDASTPPYLNLTDLPSPGAASLPADAGSAAPSSVHSHMTNRSSDETHGSPPKATATTKNDPTNRTIPPWALDAVEHQKRKREHDARVRDQRARYDAQVAAARAAKRRADDARAKAERKLDLEMAVRYKTMPMFGEGV